MDWINVKDRLPEENGSYLTYRGEGYSAGPRIDRKRFTNGVWSRKRCEGKITHWMPLPEPPEES